MLTGLIGRFACADGKLRDQFLEKLAPAQGSLNPVWVAPPAQTVRGELDWIVMKALEKDRTRRYESASALAADVGAYLKDEPVKACPPSATYRVRKFARRNKTVLTTALVVSLALLVGHVDGKSGAGCTLRSPTRHSASRPEAEQPPARR